METKPFASPWPPTEVRWKSESPYDQRPRMYHLATVPSSSFGCTSDWTQVPGGVFVFQDETSSVNWKLRVVQSDVHVPESYVPEPSTCCPRTVTAEKGSVYAKEPRFLEA